MPAVIALQRQACALPRPRASSLACRVRSTESAPRSQLQQAVYNISSFNPSAGEIRDLVWREFKNANITFRPDDKRQAIVDSWPADVDDSAAKRDWSWAPAYDQARAFEEYLIPGIKKRYRG